MINVAVAKRYGQALLQIAQENNSLDAYQADFKAIVETLEQNAELADALTGQSASLDAKKKIVKEVFANQVDANLLNLLCVVIDKGREDFIGDIYNVFCELADEVRNIAYADVASAFPMTAEQEEALAARLSEAFGKAVKLNVSVDPSLIGGIVVKYGDKVYDGTVGARLEGIRNKLHEVQF